MPAGRPRLPTKLKLLRGNPGRRPIDPTEPQPEIKIPTPPEIVTGVALEEWNRITKELLDLGLVAELNRALLAGYCKAYADWLDAENHWETEPRIFKTETGYPVVNPWRAVADKAFDRMHKIATGFGLDPASMSRIRGSTGPTKKEQAQGARRFLA